MKVARARLAALGLLLAAGAAAADGLPPGAAPVALAARGGRLAATVDLAGGFPPDLHRQLSNGLTNVVTLHVAVLPERGGDPVALFGREIDVLYDVWEERWLVTVKDSAGPRVRAFAFDRWEALAAFLRLARDLDLGPLSELGGRRWVAQARLELNPVSKELLDRTREFIANPASGRAGGPSRSVLGAMASYLLRGADPGSEVQVFRSAPFTAAEVRPP